MNNVLQSTHTIFLLIIFVIRRRIKRYFEFVLICIFVFCFKLDATFSWKLSLKPSKESYNNILIPYWPHFGVNILVSTQKHSVITSHFSHNCKCSCTIPLKHNNWLEIVNKWYTAFDLCLKAHYYVLFYVLFIVSFPEWLTFYAKYDLNFCRNNGICIHGTVNIVVCSSIL